ASLDTTFGPDQTGIALTHLGDGSSEASAVAIQPDGKIVVVGNTSNDDLLGQHDEFAIARYNPNGTLDKSFDDDGRKSIELQDESDAHDVVLQKDGKIVVVGSTFNTGFFNASEDDFA